MNWRLSMLDRYRLVSNSDAHSPGKIGREATTFETDLDYFAIRRALETGDGYVGTVEFFPEEGKYHLDGHRKCGVRMEPEETRGHDNRCPVCGQPATIGVLHRVEVLADRSEAEAAPPSTAGEVSNLVSLPEILSELVSSGPSSKAVERNYDRLIATLGSELSILGTIPVEDIARSSSSLLAEAIARLRAGRVTREAGYDGEYGTIRLFDEAELRKETSGGSLFGDAVQPKPARRTTPPKRSEPKKTEREPAALLLDTAPAKTSSAGILASLDEDQRRAVEAVDGPLAIVAGPGSGKTRTLTHRIAYLVAERGVPASACLAITFTRRAAAEMQERLEHLLPGGSCVEVHTFHSLGLAILREHWHAAGLHDGFHVAGEAERAALLSEKLGLSPQRAGAALRAISRAKRTGDVGSAVSEAFAAYQDELASRNWVDFDDLVLLACRVLSADAEAAERYRRQYRWISVDEFQDVDEQQYGLLTALAPPGSNFCVIGDPHQAIYGFRGADASCFDRFSQDYAGAATIHLTRNYRSTGTIVTASSQVIARSDGAGSTAAIVREMHDRITVHAAATDRAEAEFVVQSIERLIGGHSFFSLDSGRAAGGANHTLGFSDFAVLYRTSAQADALCEALGRSGLPFAKHSHEPLAEHPAVLAIFREWERDPSGSENGGDLHAQLTAAAARLSADGGAFDAGSKEASLHRLCALAGACGGDRDRFVDALALATDADFRDPRAECISLLTLHAAKGLEFAVVFIVGLEDGVLPLYWNDLDEPAASEERRLFYVGMTRAKDRLILSRASERMWRGKPRTMSASRFLEDIEQELVKQQRAEPGRRKPEDRQMRLL